MSRPTMPGSIASRAGTPDQVFNTPTPNANVSMLGTTTFNQNNHSPATRPSLSPGPSKKEPALITSRWGIGFQTPALILLFYLIAALISVIHLLLFRYLHGKEANGAKAVASQTYISTASNILANGFGFSIRASLAIAFTQYLWHLLRVQTMKVSTIELLFSIRNNPFQLLRMAVLRATPTLCALAVIIWATQIATGFPPGALNVVNAQIIEFKMVPVPTFNASFMGNGSGVDANTNSLINLDPDISNKGFTTGDTTDQGRSTGLINRLSRQILIAGEELALPSPCGANCSFSLEFEGPYVFCDNFTTTHKIVSSPVLFDIYSAKLLQPIPGNLGQRPYNGTYTQAQFNATTLTPLSFVVDNTNSSLDVLTYQQDNITCTPGRAKYTLNHTYKNNIHTKNVTTEPIDKLINLNLNTHDSVVLVPGFCAPNGTHAFGTEPANWTTSTLQYYRDNNMMAIFSAMMSWLNGTFTAGLASADTTNTPTADIAYIMQWEETVQLQAGVVVSTGAQGRTVIDSTRFNSAFGSFNSSNAAFPAFTVTQDTLNEYLLNLTTSISLAYERWPTLVNATTSTSTSVYAFSQPLNLIIPYFLTLLLSLPFLAVGYWALLKNGVSAIDGGFMQVITTTTGSDALDKAAAGGCLGGDENAPQELKNLKIRFGEFIGRDEPGRVRRAGFGVEGEVTDLQKGANYGVARWI